VLLPSNSANCSLPKDHIVFGRASGQFRALYRILAANIGTSPAAVQRALRNHALLKYCGDDLGWRGRWYCI
jgi:hypothetical protein